MKEPTQCGARFKSLREDRTLRTSYVPARRGDLQAGVRNVDLTAGFHTVQ